MKKSIFCVLLFYLKIITGRVIVPGKSVHAPNKIDSSEDWFALGKYYASIHRPYDVKKYVPYTPSNQTSLNSQPEVPNYKTTDYITTDSPETSTLLVTLIGSSPAIETTTTTYDSTTGGTTEEYFSTTSENISLESTSHEPDLESTTPNANCTDEATSFPASTGTTTETTLLKDFTTTALPDITIQTRFDPDLILSGGLESTTEIGSTTTELPSTTTETPLTSTEPFTTTLSESTTEVASTTTVQSETTSEAESKLNPKEFTTEATFTTTTELPATTTDAATNSTLQPETTTESGYTENFTTEAAINTTTELPESTTEAVPTTSMQPETTTQADSGIYLTDTTPATTATTEDTGIDSEIETTTIPATAATTEWANLVVDVIRPKPRTFTYSSDVMPETDWD